MSFLGRGHVGGVQSEKDKEGRKKEEGEETYTEQKKKVCEKWATLMRNKIKKRRENEDNKENTTISKSKK